MIKGTVQKNKGYFFVVLDLRKIKPKVTNPMPWIKTGLKTHINGKYSKANEKKAYKIKEIEELKINMQYYGGKEELSPTEKDLKYRDILFCDYMIEWLKNMKPKVVQSTYIGYEQVIKGKMYHYFKENKIKLTSLKPKDIQEFINYLYQQGLKGTTITHYTANINNALKEAVISEIIAYNPMDRIPKIKKEEYIPDFYTDGELMNLIETIKSSTLELPLTLGILYGLRREEILGLTWEAIDFNNKSITIRKTVGRGKYNGITQFLIKDIPKNKSSYRTLPLFDFIADLLKKYKEKYKQSQKFFGNTYIQDYKNFICLMENGELIKPDYIDRTFSKILKDNNFRHIRLHDLRHSCATLLLRNGVSLEEIQKWLGHSNIITTQRYAHLDKSDKTIPANMIESKFNLSFTKDENKKEQISIGTR